MSILIAFFSMKGETMDRNMQLISLEKGYTASAAEIIREATGGDLFEIERLEPYPSSHEELTKEATAEQENNIRPELKTFPENMEQYDTMFLCYPNWWGTLPMPVVTFLEHFDWTGKVIIPLNTSDGSGAGGSRQRICSLCRGAAVKKVLEVRGYEVADSRKKIQNWADSQI